MVDSGKAARFLGLIGGLIVDTKISSLKHDYIFPSETLTELSSCFDKSDLIETTNINEVGTFLLRKLTFMPESFDACKDVIARYDQEDLYKVWSSLHKGVNESNPDLVYMKNIELSEILENVWSDARLENRIKGVRYGIPISTALIGTLATGPVGGIGGLLSGLGIEILAENKGQISDKLAKKTVSNHMISIFDFKKKYDLDKKI